MGIPVRQAVDIQTKVGGFKTSPPVVRLAHGPGQSPKATRQAHGLSKAEGPCKRKISIVRYAVCGIRF